MSSVGAIFILLAAAWKTSVELLFTSPVFSEPRNSSSSSNNHSTYIFPCKHLNFRILIFLFSSYSLRFSSSYSTSRLYRVHDSITPNFERLYFCYIFFLFLFIRLKKYFVLSLLQIRSLQIYLVYKRRIKVFKRYQFFKWN